MLSSVALLIEINLCNLLVQMLFFSPWLNAITRGEYLYFIILLKLIEGSWMYKVLESVTLDTQHVISWMHLITHELSLVLQKDGLGPSILSSNTSCFSEGFSALHTKRMFPFLCFVTRQHQPRCVSAHVSKAVISWLQRGLKRCFPMIIVDVFMVVGVHCYVANEFVCSIFYNFWF